MNTQISKAQENPSLGVMLMIGFAFCAPFGRLRKIGKETIPVGQVTTARFFFQAIIMLRSCGQWDFRLASQCV